MARVRDYRAEYARRVERERERAAREGREFSLAKARGHIAPEYERAQQARLRGISQLEHWTRKTAGGLDLDEYRAVVHEAVDRMTEVKGNVIEARAFVVQRLRTKYQDAVEFMARVAKGMTYKEAATGSGGHHHYFTGRLEYLPVEVYWYHGAGR